MTLALLDNLVEIGKLSRESPDQAQIDGLIELATERLSDIETTGISRAGKFSAAYAVAHSLGLAAMRWHGYRSDNRYLVFQCLQHTLGLENAKWRVLDKCHRLRNSIEYEGVSNIDDQLLLELISIAKELMPMVEALGPVK